MKGKFKYVCERAKKEPLNGFGGEKLKYGQMITYKDHFYEKAMASPDYELVEDKEIVEDAVIIEEKPKKATSKGLMVS
jgi:hypothetical protein